MGRSYSHLSCVEREEISRPVASGAGGRSTARQLARSASTVSRELRRNAERPTRDRAKVAQWRAQRRARSVRRPRKLATDRWLRRYVGRRLQAGWSPHQIAARLRRDYPRDVAKRISHERSTQRFTSFRAGSCGVRSSTGALCPALPLPRGARDRAALARRNRASARAETAPGRSHTRRGATGPGAPRWGPSPDGEPPLRDRNAIDGVRRSPG